jgi:transcription initiation factor TFIID subunit 1
MQNNLFRALLFQHATSPQDFLVIRSHIKGKPGSKLYLRALPPQTLLVGQVFPTAAIPGPHSRKQNMFARARVQVFAYRLFGKDATAAATGRPRLKISRILAAFPQYSEGSVRKWLKEYAESVRQGTDSGVWQRKTDAPVLGEDDLRALVSPEMVCTNEAMLVGQQRLQDAGVDLRSGPGAAADDLDDGDDDEAALLDEDTAAELQLAPWNLSANLANAILGKSALQLRGQCDPSGGRGEAFSFLRIPSKLAAAKISDATAAGNTSIVY